MSNAGGRMSHLRPPTRHGGMTPAYIAFLSVTILTAVANAAAAVVDFARAQWVLANMARAEVPESWLSRWAWRRPQAQSACW